MYDIATWLKRKAIQQALKRNSPRRISYSESNVRNINCYTVFLRSEEVNGLDLIVEELTPTEINGFQFQVDSYEEQRSFKADELKNCDLKIIHYLRHLQTTYDSAFDFWRGELTFLPQRFLVKQAIFQWLHNKTTRFRHDRVNILKQLVDLHLSTEKPDGLFAGNNDEQSAIGLFEALYGSEVFAHPKFELEYRRFNLILESFCENGEISRTNGRYRLEGKAISTIAEFEEAERRHQNGVSQNRRLVWLTLVIAAAASAQVLIPFFSDFAFLGSQ